MPIFFVKDVILVIEDFLDLGDRRCSDIFLDVYDLVVSAGFFRFDTNNSKDPVL